MTHECDDIPYPAAAMPGECTCPPEERAAAEERERQAARVRIFGTDPEEDDR